MSCRAPFQTKQVRSSFLHTRKRHSQTQTESDARLLNPTQYRDISKLCRHAALCLFLHTTGTFQNYADMQRYVSSYTIQIYFLSYADSGMSLRTQYRDILKAMQTAVCLFVHNRIISKLCGQRYVSSYTILR